MESYAITISPDPKWVVQRRPIHFYRNLDLKTQYSKLSWEIIQAIKYTEERYPDKMKMNGTFELNKSGQLHFHGILQCSGEQVIFYQQWIYDEVGKMTFKDDTILKKICCNVQLLSENNKYRTNNGLISWEQYMLKDQTEKWSRRFPELSVGFNLIYPKGLTK